MADTPAVRRLMLHAADLLDEQDPSANAAAVVRISSSPSTCAEATLRAQQESVAIATASTVLRMVAAIMTDPEDEADA